MAKVTITHEFDYYEEKQEIRQLANLSEYYMLIWDIDQSLRDKLKHGQDKWLEHDAAQEYLESLRDLILESGALRDD